MWVNGASAPAAKKVKRGDREDDNGGSQNKMLHNLDTRLRSMEGRTATYFLTPTSPFVSALQTANEAYDSKKPAKGQPHEFGPRRTTLAGAFLVCLSQVDLTACSSSEQELVKFFNQVAAATGQPTVEKQKELLANLVAHYTTPKLLEPEISVCQFFKTRKQDKFIFAIEFQPHSPLRHCYELVRVGLISSGATLADGSPPRGPLIREIPRS